MRINFLGRKGTWREVANSANTTIAREAGTKEPSSGWKRRMLLAEHSPIRQLLYKWKWYDIPYWVSTHFVRHWLGIVHWVRTQRTDRTGKDRNKEPQGAYVEHEAESNAQTVITISRKRLCFQASPETREAWEKVKAEIYMKDPEVARCMVRDCVYRGWCYEYTSCGYHHTEQYQRELEHYREGINIIPL